MAGDLAAVRALKTPSRRFTPTLPSPHPAPTVAGSANPSEEGRLVALFQFWGVIHYFYPYLHLMGSAWDDALLDMIPRFRAAESEAEYAGVIAELAARIPDAHVTPWGTPAVRRYRPSKSPRVEVRGIGQDFVITAIDPMQAPGLVVGDVVERVDGEPMAERLARFTRYVAAGNDDTRRFLAARAALAGDAGSEVVLSVAGADGTTREVRLVRKAGQRLHPRSGPVYRILDDGIGYVDLDRLSADEVDPMFKELAQTRAIIFDMRGYPNGVMYALAAHLNTRHGATAALFYEPFVSTGSATSTFFEQPLPPLGPQPYVGKTIMLVDERTLSQAEHTGLFLEAANGTTFVGSHTAGANGDVTFLVLPGGIGVSFTGHDVRHADGRQLQIVGLTPDVEVRPTLAGIRAGRDEVLERALAYVRGTP